MRRLPESQSARQRVEGVLRSATIVGERNARSVHPVDCTNWLGGATILQVQFFSNAELTWAACVQCLPPNRNWTAGEKCVACEKGGQPCGPNERYDERPVDVS